MRLLERIGIFVGRTAYRIIHRKQFARIRDMKRRVAMLQRGDVQGVLGSMVPYAGQKWEISKVEPVEQNWTDPNYRYRLALVQRDKSGKVVNCATGVRNTCIG